MHRVCSCLSRINPLNPLAPPRLLFSLLLLLSALLSWQSMVRPSSAQFLLLSLLCARVSGLSSVPPPTREFGPSDAAYLFHRRPLPDAAAVCNDGSRAAWYYRNCTANADRKPGDDTDYCAGPQTLVIHFLGSALPPPVWASPSAPPPGSYCYSPASCASRALELKSSTTLPLTAFPPGVTSSAPEVNPNLYKARGAIVPYCTSDLFAGASAAFAGRAVVDAALFALANPNAPLPDGGLGGADRVILIGPAGVIARLDELSARLLALKRSFTHNASAALAIFGVCDGCALVVAPVPPASPPPACTSDADCPPALALPQLAANAALQRPPWCAAGTELWACYAADALVASLRTSKTPALVLMQQFDAVQVRSYGGAPTWAGAVFAPLARAAARAAQFAISAACSGPALVTPSPALFDTRVTHTDAAHNVSQLDPLIWGFTSFLEDSASDGGGPAAFAQWVDECSLEGCGDVAAHCRAA